MSGIGASGPHDTVVIDTSSLTRPRLGTVGRTSVILKQSGLALAGIVGSLLWFFGVMILSIRLSEGSTNEAVIGIMGVVLGAAPMLLLILFFVRFRHRHYSGIGGMIAATDLGEPELSRPLAELGVTMQAVIDGVAAMSARLGAIPGRVAEQDPEKRRKARNLVLGLLATAVLAVVLFAVTESMVAALPLLAALAGYPLVLRRARQAVQPSLETVRANDPRKPVLLLRSFQDDAVEMVHRVPTRIGDVEQNRRFEQQLAGMFEAFGPLIAIGRPGEDLPQLGAARGYRTEAEWQSEVIRWIDESLFIALIAGPTEWVRWELGRILEMGEIRKLLVLLPPKTDGPARWDNVLAALNSTRWHPALRSLDTVGLLVAVLRTDGTVLAIRRGGKAAPYADDYQVAIAIALYEMFCRDPGVTG